MKEELHLSLSGWIAKANKQKREREKEREKNEPSGPQGLPLGQLESGERFILPHPKVYFYKPSPDSQGYTYPAPYEPQFSSKCS